jgi:hypothetical protein
MLGQAGFSKAGVAAWLVEHCGVRQSELRSAGKDGLDGRVRHAGGTTGDDFVRVLPSPRHVLVVVAGARNAAISMVVRTFGVWSGVAMPVESAPLTVAPGGGDDR